VARLHLVLVGLSGCGKSVAGRLAARRLGAPFTDLDETIAAEEGRSIAELFESTGEPRFRVLERAAMMQALNQPAGVIAPGGGWAAQPGNLDQVQGKALLVYLRVTPGTAADRLKNGAIRPLLAGRNPVERLTELLSDREPFYRQAAHSIDTDGRTPDSVADVLVNLARQKGGWQFD
jgi:shikimate kinase